MSALYCVVRESDDEVIGASVHNFHDAMNDTHRKDGRAKGRFMFDHAEWDSLFVEGLSRGGYRLELRTLESLQPLAPGVVDAVDPHWWCDRCQQPVAPTSVTYEECHRSEGCGARVRWVESPPVVADAATRAVEALWREHTGYVLLASDGTFVGSCEGVPLTDTLTRAQKMHREYAGDLYEMYKVSGAKVTAALSVDGRDG